MRYTWFIVLTLAVKAAFHMDLLGCNRTCLGVRM